MVYRNKDMLYYVNLKKILHFLLMQNAKIMKDNFHPQIIQI